MTVGCIQGGKGKMATVNPVKGYLNMYVMIRTKTQHATAHTSCQGDQEYDHIKNCSMYPGSRLSCSHGTISKG
jgi:hypothetical protein